MFDKSGNIVGVFKPTDEEIMCSSNPKKHPDSPTRKGILPGEGAHREVAAYYLGGDAAGVPPTALVEIRNSSLGPAKTGSLQRVRPAPLTCFFFSFLPPSPFPVFAGQNATC
jgi:hypothetical protein